MGNVMPCGGSRNSSTSGRGGLWAAANLSGLSTRSSSSQLPEFNGRSASKDMTAASVTTNAKQTSGTFGCRKSSFVGLRSTPHHTEHQLRMRRPPKLRCQLGLAKNSHTCSAIKWACETLGIEVLPPPTTSLTSEAVLNSWTTANREGQPPHVIILDCRANKRLDVETVARSIRQGVHGDHVVLIGIVKRNMIEREELVVDNYLQVGFNRILVDSGSRGYWLNELAMIIHTDVEACLRLQCADLLLTALDHCRDVIQVTDSQDRVIYENNSTEKNLGYSSSDWFEKSIWDFQTTIGLTESVLNENETTTIKGSDLVRQKLDHGKVWEGSLSCRRKGGDTLTMDTRIVPVSFTSKRIPDNLVYIRVPPSGEENSQSALIGGSRRMSKMSTTFKDVPNEGSGSASASISSMMRRTSSAKIYHHLSVEAPITKVINILMSARESSPPYIAQALDKVLEIIQTHTSIDLFHPDLEKEKQRRTTDAVTTDLLGALLSNSTRDALHQRRSSSDLTSVHPNTSIGAATGASSGRSASISVTTGLYNRNSSNTSNNLTEVDGRGGVNGS